MWRLNIDIVAVLGPILTVVFSAACGAIAGVLVGEWRARAAEKRADQRSGEAEARSRAHYFEDLERAEYLAQLDQTELDYVGTDDFLLARLGGNVPAMLEAKQGIAHYPKAEIYLIAASALLREVMRFRLDLGSRALGSGVSPGEINRMGILRGQVMTVLGVQRGRLLRGLELEWIPIEELQAIQREFLARARISGEEDRGPGQEP